MSNLVRSLMTIGLSAVFVVSCRFTEGDTKIQYVPDMADAPLAKAQRTYLDPPEHSVPVNGVLYPSSIEEAEKELRNPYPPSDAVIAAGKVVYEKYCITCHGADGRGEHSLGNYPMSVKINEAQYKNRGDGYFFYLITKGGANMPGYGHSISVHERWQIIHYLRTLQN